MPSIVTSENAELALKYISSAHVVMKHRNTQIYYIQTILERPPETKRNRKTHHHLHVEQTPFNVVASRPIARAEPAANATVKLISRSTVKKAEIST